MRITDSKGRRVAVLDNVYWKTIEGLEAEAARREGRPPRLEGLAFFSFEGHPDLEAARERAVEEADTRLRNPPPLRVKLGDWVRIGGYRFLITDVDPAMGFVTTRYLHPHGVSSVPCRGEGLVPDASDAPDGAPVGPPDDLHDGLDRARWWRHWHLRTLGDRAK